MKKGSTVILKLALCFICLIVLGICTVLLPLGILSDKVGYYRPILVGMYVPAFPFFFALFQSWKLLSYIDQNKAFSELSMNALKNIKYSGVVIAALFAAGMPYIFYAANRDDAPGIVVIGLVIIFASFVVATFAALLQRLLKEALDIKTENDLTV